jgi:hypothetical protein
MTPAAYTPVTLNRIRAGASAAELGWSDQRFATICQRHGLGSRIPLSECRPVVAPPQGGLAFNAKMLTISIGGKSVQITRPMAALFEVLLNRHRARNTELVSGDDLGALVAQSVHRAQISQTICRMNRRLATIALWIEGRKGNNGGYRLRVEGSKHEASSDRANATQAPTAM